MFYVEYIQWGGSDIQLRYRIHIRPKFSTWTVKPEQVYVGLVATLRRCALWTKETTNGFRQENFHLRFEVPAVYSHLNFLTIKIYRIFVRIKLEILTFDIKYLIKILVC